MKGNYTIIDEKIDDSGKYKSRVIKFKLNDYDIEFTGESSCYCKSQYCLSCSYGFKTNYLTATNEFLIKKFIEENNIPDNLLELRYFNYKTIIMYISSKDDISKVANYSNKYVKYIQDIENNSNVKFSFPSDIYFEFNPLNKDEHSKTIITITIDDLVNEKYYFDYGSGKKTEYNNIEQFLNDYVKYYNFKF